MQIRPLPLQLLSSLILGLSLMPQAVQAQSAGTVSLSDGNSQVLFNLDDFSVERWTVDGANQLYSGPPFSLPLADLFFLNIAPADNLPEVRLGQFQLNSVEQPSERALKAYLTGFGGILDFEYETELQGGQVGSGFSLRDETITLTNRSSTQQFVSLFSYIDFDLAGTSSNDSLLIQGNTLLQTDPSGLRATVTVNQTPSQVQADSYPVLLASLYNSSRTTLSNKNSLPLGDATAALQFDRFLAPGESVVLRLSKQLQGKEKPQDVPEPASAIALGTAAAALLLKHRQKAS